MSDECTVPVLLREAGFRFEFTSRDRPEPPHVHVVGNGGTAKVWLMPSARIVKMGGYSGRQREHIIRISQAHRDEWLSAWRHFFQRGADVGS